jgi:hypothetical protein
MTDTMAFAEMLIAANESKTKTGRGPGQWTPTACQVWREAEPEVARLLDAAIALELRLDRKVTTADEDQVRGMRAEMDAATAAVKAKQESSSPT